MSNILSDTPVYSHGYIFWKNAVQEKDWKDALDFLIASLREFLVFDNLAISIIDKSGETSEIAYARAVGREKEAEADANWGEEITTRVLEKNEIVLQVPKEHKLNNRRVESAYLLGLPLQASGKLIGAMNLIRFGGPEYKQTHIDLAALAAVVISYIFEKRALQESIAELESVQRQMRLQDDFVSTMSHELRTPLGFIKGYSTTLLREDTQWDEVTRREFLTIIDEETDHLTELIENILESARLESETVEMNFQPLRIDVLIRDVITRFKSRYDHLDIYFDVIDCEIIQGDSTRLTQVFENLFSNAVKYAPQSSISISVNTFSETYVQMIFEDQGTGIPKEHLPFIFDRFYRVPEQPGKAGTGLGLFICNQIIEAHHGKIWAESEEQKGTRFIIQLPTQ
ncbi:MAG: HAMP domain-containing histidine kinase [Anaerolineae bacterium]|nr:HAMP domain-containing histidine kinase [Anaerolineae bacterium]